jgi:hypothetical protein
LDGGDTGAEEKDNISEGLLGGETNNPHRIFSLLV